MGCSLIAENFGKQKKKSNKLFQGLSVITLNKTLGGFLSKRLKIVSKRSRAFERVCELLPRLNLQPLSPSFVHPDVRGVKLESTAGPDWTRGSISLNLSYQFHVFGHNGCVIALNPPTYPKDQDDSVVGCALCPPPTPHPHTPYARPPRSGGLICSC